MNQEETNLQNKTGITQHFNNYFCTKIPFVQ